MMDDGGFDWRLKGEVKVLVEVSNINFGDTLAITLWVPL